MLRIMLDSFRSIPEEMGRALRRTAYSPNIKERMDASCALFDGNGVLLAQAEHIPVHLGSMPLVVTHVLGELHDLDEGDVLMVNDPAFGGTHLPDITMIIPVHHEGDRVAFLVNRAHHADIGGMSPGSMPAGSTELHQEGFIIPPVRIMREGKENRDVMDLLLANTRTPVERRGDLRAQLSACVLGKRRYLELVDRYGLSTVKTYERMTLHHSWKLTHERLMTIPDGLYHGEGLFEMDRQPILNWNGMSNIGPQVDNDEDDKNEDKNEDNDNNNGDVDKDGIRDVRICVRIAVKEGKVSVDFSGTEDELTGNLNAPPAVARSAASYVFRCVTGSDIPNNEGCMRDIHIHIPHGTMLNPSRNSAICSGNVETSQRIVETLFSALGNALPDMIPASSQGTMNNIIIGGKDFSYYETLGGGEGAHPWRDGESGIHTGMTNTANTPVEAIELAYPLRIREYSLIRNSGGKGLYRGGEGLKRSIEVLCDDVCLSILSSNRRLAPPGRNSGGPGRPGRNLIRRQGKDIELPGLADARLKAGDVVIIETPGGGGWGKEEAGDVVIKETPGGGRWGKVR